MKAADDRTIHRGGASFGRFATVEEDDEPGRLLVSDNAKRR